MYLTYISCLLPVYLAVPPTTICGWLLSGSVLYKEELAILLCFCCAGELDDHVVCDA